MALLDSFQEHVAAAHASNRPVEVAPSLSVEGIAELERVHGRLSDELRAFLQYASGFHLEPIGRIDFRGTEAFEFEAIPTALPIASDGQGNFWVIVPQAGAAEAVLFVAHDPPVIVLQATDLVVFMEQCFTTSGPASATKVAVKRVATGNPDVISRREALRSDDPKVREFAGTLPDRAVIADLRGTLVGRGFCWGVAGPQTKVWAAPSEPLLFATERKRRGILSFLTGR